jgi:hypothetical protein
LLTRFNLQDLPASVKQGYTKAQAAAKLRAASETAVNAARPADHDLLAAFMAYLKLEEVAGDSFRQQVTGLHILLMCI